MHLKKAKMRIKRKIGKKLPVFKAVEDKVPVAWETPKSIPDIPYCYCSRVQDLNWNTEDERRIKYKIAEEERDIWNIAGIIDELVFSHATLQNVDFEWGKSSRPYRYQPQVRVCGQVNELEIVRKGKETEVVYETATELAVFNVEICKIKTKTTGKYKTDRIKRARVEVNEEYMNTTLEDLDPNEFSQQIETFKTNKDDIISKQMKYKLCEEEPEVWGLEFIIPDLVYEHALLQNVEFEWGTWSRPVQLRPDVKGREEEHIQVKKAEVIDIFYETTKTFPAVTFDKCTVVFPEPAKLARRVFPNLKECKYKKEEEFPNYIYKNSKYYCKRCNEYICNTCFTTECIDHDVQWMGNATFRCESPGHKLC